MTRVRTVLIFSGAVALGICAAILWFSFVSPPLPVFLSGPTSVRKVYETKWRGKVKPETRLVPVNASIEFLPRDQVVKASKIKDAPDNIVAVGQVPPHSGKTTVFGTLKAGPDNVLRGGLEYRQEATPFFALKREIGIRGGYGTQGVVGEVYVRPLRLGPMDLEARVYGREGNGNSAVGAAILLDARF